MQFLDGEKNPITGIIVCAKVKIKKSEDEKECINKIKILCNSNLDRFKVPIKINIVKENLYGTRFKKKR